MRVLTAERRRLVLGAIAASFFLICFRPVVAFIAYTKADDLCYLGWAAWAVGEQVAGCVSSSFPPGVALMWFPAALVARVLSLIFSQDFAGLLSISVGLLSFGYWTASLFLLDAILEQAGFKGQGYGRLLAPLVVLLNIPVLYYATHRTTLVHAPEIFLALLVVYFSYLSKEKFSRIASVLLASLRLNDLPAIFFAFSLGKLGSRKARRRLGVAVLGVLVTIGVILGGPGYNGVDFAALLRGPFERNAFFYAVFVDPSWGLLYTAPVWLWAVVAGLRFMRRDPKITGALAWLLAELAVVMCWWGPGSDFAYRYLIGSYAAALWIVLRVWDWLSKREQNALRVLLAVEAAWMFWLNWIYKERPEVTPFPTEFVGWVHPRQQLNSLKAFADPSIYLQPLQHSPFAALVSTPASEMSSPAFVALLMAVVAALAVFLFCVVSLVRSSRKERRT